MNTNQPSNSSYDPIINKIKSNWPLYLFAGLLLFSAFNKISKSQGWSKLEEIPISLRGNYGNDDKDSFRVYKDGIQYLSSY